MLKILLVEDEPTVQKVFKQILEMENFAVDTASSARDGISALQSDTFDIVISDLRMETPFAGYEVVKAARQAPSPPLIALVTAYPIPSSDWKRAGADALFVKGSSDAINLGREIQRLWNQHYRVCRDLAVEKRA